MKPTDKCARCGHGRSLHGGDFRSGVRCAHRLGLAEWQHCGCRGFIDAAAIGDKCARPGCGCTRRMHAATKPGETTYCFDCWIKHGGGANRDTGACVDFVEPAGPR